MFRLTLTVFALIPLAFSQNLPAFRWVTEVDGSGLDSFTGLGVDAQGNTYIAGTTSSTTFPVKAAVQNHLAGSRNVYVTKLDALGNIVYSTYYGGSAEDLMSAMTVDPAANVYVTGVTSSLDFPVTAGAYSDGGATFLFKLNPDGSVGYSTYFAPAIAAAIAVDSAGSAYLVGSTSTQGAPPVTPGAYQTVCNCGIISDGFQGVLFETGFVTKFDPTGSSLIYSTYIGGTGVFESVANALALASDGTAYIGGINGIVHLNATGSSLLASLPPTINAGAMAVGPDGSLYAAGAPGNGLGDTIQFQPTAGAFEPNPPGAPVLPGSTLPPLRITAVEKMDAQFAGVLAATYFGGPYDAICVMTFDSAGNLYLGGNTVQQGLPTRTPLQGGFAASTGFMSELSGDLSTLIFSSYFGDTQSFAVQGVGADPDGTIRIGGATGLGNIWVNSLTLAPPPALRVDAVENAASQLDGPISAGETIMVEGARFGSTAQLLLGGAVVPAISITATTITAVVPQNIPPSAVEVQVQSGGASSNQVLIQVAVTSPGIFSQNGSGYGQGYILNKDGTLNTPSNPAAPGDPITIFATGVGPVSFTNGYAVTQFPVNVFFEGLYAEGVAAVMGPVSGFPGSVFQITVYVPNPLNFAFPPLVGVTMQIDGVSSQNGIAISISQ